MPSSSDIRSRLTSIHSRIGNTEIEKEEPQRESCAAASAAGRSQAEDILQGVPTPGLLDLVELILKDRPRLEKVIRDPSLAAELLPRFLAIALICFTLFGVALALVFQAIGVYPMLAPIKLALDGTTLLNFEALDQFGTTRLFGAFARSARLIAAYDVGLIAAAGVCLPSLYFYGLLAGVPMSLARVTVHTVKAMATTAVALVGILPIYMAFSLGAAIFHAPRVLSDSILWMGLVLPFIAGLFGVRSLYFGFTALTDALPEERQSRRACFLRRLVVSWSVCYTAVTPVMIYSLWEYFAR